MLRLVLALSLVLGTAAFADTRMWTADAGQRIATTTAAPATLGGTVRMVGARGGSASGQVVVAADAPLAALTATVADLARDGGKETIPAKAVRVYYPSRQIDLTGRKDADLGQTAYFDTLSATLIPGEMVQPVWLTAEIPADAVAGTYRGAVRVEAAGATQTLPISLTVAAYAAPATGASATWVGLRYSPESLAERYGVPMYSDAHFALLEQSLRLAGQLGGNVLYVPVIAGTNFGFRHGLIQFRRDGETLTPDFTAFDRYWALYLKYCGAPKMVVVQWWFSSMGKTEKNTLALTIRQGDTLESAQTTLRPEDKACWKALFDGMRARLAKAGLTDDALRAGLATDSRPLPETQDYLKEIAPGVKWAAWTHGYGWFNDITFAERPDLTPGIGNDGLRRGWDSPTPQILTPRVDITDDSTPLRSRYITDLTVGRHKMGWFRGIGEVGLDFWALPAKTGRGRSYRLYTDDCRLVRNIVRAVTAAGPNGAIPTVRFQQMREGVVEAEARIAIEQAIVAKKLPAARAAEAQAFLKERFAGAMADFSAKDNTDAAWLDRAEKLFVLAAEAQQAMAAK